MTGKKLAVFILLIVSMELLFCTVDAWRRRRRRRRYIPPAPAPTTKAPTTLPPTTPSCDSSIPQPTNAPADFKWNNKWHQSFYAYCPNSKFIRSTVFLNLPAVANVKCILCNWHKILTTCNE